MFIEEDKEAMDRFYEEYYSNLKQTSDHELVKLQREFCNEKGYPLFVPTDGKCYACHQNIFEGERGYTKEAASTEFITGCPHCYRSFCD